MALPLVTAWSYSRYGDYAQCPLKFKLKHIDRVPDEASPAMARGNAIHKMAEDFVGLRGDVVGTGGKRVPGPVPPELKNFAASFLELQTMNTFVEQTWGFKRDWSWTGRSGWFGEDVWLRAKVDVGVLYDDNSAEVIDHKTGKKYETNEDQIELFASTAFMRFPNVEHVTARLWYLDIEDPKQNEVIKEYDRKDFERIKRDWEKRIKPMFADRKFPARPSQRCGWCAYSARKGGNHCKY